jgi:hypothetical protein
MPWRVEILNEIVAAEITALPADMQARFLRLSDRIGRRVVVVRAFVKKTQKTPPAEIQLALRPAKEVT